MVYNPPSILKNLKNTYQLRKYEICKYIISLLITLESFPILNRDSPDVVQFYSRVTQPLFYEDIIEKFTDKSYNSPIELYSDLMLLWNNCIEYYKEKPKKEKIAYCLIHVTKMLWFSTLFLVK